MYTRDCLTVPVPVVEGVDGIVGLMTRCQPHGHFAQEPPRDATIICTDPLLISTFISRIDGAHAPFSTPFTSSGADSGITVIFIGLDGSQLAGSHEMNGVRLRDLDDRIR